MLLTDAEKKSIIKYHASEKSGKKVTWIATTFILSANA